LATSGRPPPREHVGGASRRRPRAPFNLRRPIRILRLRL